MVQIAKAIALAIMAAIVVFTLPIGANAQDDQFQQVELTAEMVEKFIAAQKLIREKATEIETADGDDQQLTALLGEIAKKAGFASFEEFDNVAANVTLIMAGISLETGVYTDPKDSIRVEMEDIKADASLTDVQRKALIEELDEAIKLTPDVKFPKNVEVVKKYAKEIETALE